jgi:tetrapyrrole methylase family protein / MazG family protein
MEKLLAIMARLRAKDGCPWDAEQTLVSLKPYLIEECYEVIDAIDSGDPGQHMEELGDLLLQIVFQAQIRAEEGAFRFQDVAEAICAKLVRRHPHVFGDVKAETSSQVLRNWDAIKAGEKGADKPRSAVDGVPRSLPALQRAQQVQARAARVGFDWSATEDVVAKVDEELAEVKAALASGDEEKVGDEIGDLLFAVVNLSRFRKLHAEQMLERTIGKFIRRFQEVEAGARERGKKPDDLSLAELDALWEAAKRRERKREAI